MTVPVMLYLITILKSLRTPDGVAQKFRVCVFGVSGCNVKVYCKPM